MASCSWSKTEGDSSEDAVLETMPPTCTADNHLDCNDVLFLGHRIGGGRRLFAENGLSRERVVEIADALEVRVEAYRARTGEAAAPLPRPTKTFLERLAGSLHAEGEIFEEEWLSLEGPMAELMRESRAEPDDHTMGRDGEFARALRKAGFVLGDSPADPIL